MRPLARAARPAYLAVLALTGALLCLVPAVRAETASAARSEVGAALEELVRDTRSLSTRGATGDAREKLLKLANRAERARSRRPCRSVALLEDYRDRLDSGSRRGSRGTAKGKRSRLNRVRGELAAEALAAEAALKALDTTRGCGGGAGSAGTDFQTEILASDTQGLTLHVSLPIARFTAEKGGGQDFTHLYMGDLGPVGDPGEPGIPSLTQQFALPNGADVAVRVSNVSSYTLKGVNLYPRQEDPVDAPDPTTPGPFPGQPPESDFFDPPFTIDQQAYRSKTPFPALEAEGRSLGSMRDLRLGGVEIAGGQYTPKTETLEVFTGIEVEIDFGGQNSGVFTDTRALDPFNVAFQRIYESTLMNYDVARRNVSNTPFPYCGEELLIITSPELRPAADVLQASRSAAGYLTSVRETGSAAVGSTNAEIQSFIRSRLLADCWVRPAYVILLGNTVHVPTFLVPCKVPGADPPEDPCDVASDHPYSLKDDSDFFADTAVGRIPAPDLGTANTVVKKIIGYETAPPAPPGDSFFDHATVTAYFQPKNACVLNQGQSGEPNCKSANGPITGHYEIQYDVKKDTRGYTKVAEQVRTAMLDEGILPDRIYTTVDAQIDPEQFHDGTPMPPELQRPTFGWDGTGADLLEDFNEGRNIVFHRDHGWATGWSHPYLTTADVPLMTNGTQLPVAFGINCSSAQYDVPDVSLMEKMLQHPGGGAVGFFGDSRVSQTWANNSIARGFFDALFPALVPSYGSPDPLLRMGDVLVAGKQYLTVESTGHLYKHSHLYGYFGDPTMQLWIDRPEPIDPSIFESVLHRREPYPGPLPPGPGPDPPPYWVSVNVASQPALEGTIATLEQNGTPIGRALIENGQANIAPLSNAAPSNLSLGLEADGFIAAQDSVSP
jgi:hypothetical protein